MALDPAPGYQRYPDGVIDPLSYSEKEQGEEKQNQVALRNGLRLDGKARDHTSAANDCEGVPPVIYLQPGERITHVMAKWPNDPSSATRPAGRHDCNSDAMAGFAAAHG